MPDYTIDDLQYKGLKIKQNMNLFRFGTDAVLLSHFFDPAGQTRVCDFGCGSGILSVLIGGKNRNIDVVGIEIQEEQYLLACENIELNNLDNVSIFHGNISDALKIAGRCSAVICNPPYEKIGSGILPENECSRISRYECLIDFNGIAKAARDILGDGGKFYFIHKSSRLDEISSLLIKNGFHIKYLRFVYPYVTSESTLVLVCAVRNSMQGVKVMPPLVIYNDKGEYTNELKEIYRPHE